MKEAAPGLLGGQGERVNKILDRNTVQLDRRTVKLRMAVTSTSLESEVGGSSVVPSPHEARLS